MNPIYGVLYRCWRLGYKMPKIMNEVLKVDSTASEEDVHTEFKSMLEHELGVRY